MKKIVGLLLVGMLTCVSASLFAQTGPSPGARMNPGELASTVKKRQVMRGGARVISQCALGYGSVPIASCGLAASGSLTVDPGLGPMQFLYNNASAPTITCPTAPTEGAIFLYVLNGASAGSITISGCNVGSSTGAALTTTSGNAFTISIWNFAPGGVQGKAGYNIFAHQ